MNVMIVDDSRTHAYLVAKMLKQSGHEVVLARDGTIALELLPQHNIQVLIIAWVLPTMDGIELTRRIREDFSEPYRYIIMTTAKSGHDHLVEGLRGGVDDYMEKPVNASELEARMKIGERIVNLEVNLKRHLVEIDRAKQEWEATTNAITQLICLVNYGGSVIHVNQVVEEWGLAKLDDFPQIRIYDLLRTVFPDIGAYIEKIWPIVKSRLLNKRSFEMEEQDQTSGHYFNIQFRPIKHPEGVSFEAGEHAFAAINIQDITERKQLELEVQEANRRSEELLRNILPVPIAERLKQGELNIAESFDNVSVLFADLVGFTRLTVSTPPEQFIDLLNGVFSTFDYLSEQYGLEKIKTIGDSYMVVAGVPTPHKRHAHAVADIALDMLVELQNINDISGQSLQLRIGIDSGSVIAGVIGQKKFIYDLWGDTVNTASRMESTGTPGRIQVTKETYALLKDGYQLEKRGELDVRGKGKMVTYWLIGRKTTP